jgi:hypothetical protein
MALAERSATLTSASLEADQNVESGAMRDFLDDSTDKPS